VIGVCDQGTRGRGITRRRPSGCLRPFGRLDTPCEIEGTGLGLLSVRKIVEAHGGEAFIAGYEDGTPASPPFSTAAHGPYPSLLSGEWRTAFVVTCPLAQADAGKAAPPLEIAAAAGAGSPVAARDNTGEFAD
jgi:signal transduction histidine kinase